MAGMTSTNTKKETVVHLGSYIRVYNDGSIERPLNIPRCPPSPEDPATGVSSKDILFSKNPYLAARLFLPKLSQSNHNHKLSILVYFHGGAFCFESAFASHHVKYCNLLASQANVVIVSVEHRKAPEHFLPTAYDDCWAGLYWVASHATANPTNSDPWLMNHGDFNKIFIGGDSSGGNIVHNVAMRAGVEALPGGVKLYGAYLNHPYFWGSKPIGSEPVMGFEETYQSLIWNFAYPSAPGGLDNPMINPLAPGAPSLATLGCSKMLVTVAGKDHLHFRYRAVLYYEAVKGSGWKGEIELFEEEEEDHVYHMFNMETEQAKRLIKVVVDFLRMTSTNTKKETVVHLGSYIRVYNDGSIERPLNIPRCPPSPEDPATGVSSKDILFSKNPYLAARLFLPKLSQSNHNHKLSILVYFHGGAFCFESAFASHHVKYCNLLASQANVVIVSVEHRKAPEHFLPTAYDDCWAGLYWVASHATANPTNSDPWLMNHGDFNKVFIGGDSSGGNIVHNVAMRAGVEALPGGVKLYGAYLNHPYFWGSKPIGSEPVMGFEETYQSLIWNFAYPSAPGGLDNPMINPLAPGAPSLATLGCSKMLVTVAGKDHLHFRYRAVLYYEAVKGSGWKGEIELFEEEEEDHVYHMFNMETEQAKRLIKVVVDFLRQ
ncbi:uncharacterized protein LOC133299204 [Gastrolobium bilobum]|uniref:uncharacterized protein LOC133299204 n=1 Tax=Gastrolobium bilobum TaxID=150636 RepID=UPI002AB1D141|nr:uncharacterized protein LOC133299204 [Gastrolobium bilobum]